MRLFIAPRTGSGVSRIDPFRADIDLAAIGGRYGAFEMADGRFMVVASDATAAPANCVDLGDDPWAPVDLPPAQLGFARSRGGVTVGDESMNVGELIVANNNIAPTADNRTLVVIDGVTLYDAPAVRGGATDSFSYANGALATVSAGVWEHVQRTLDVASGHVQLSTSLGGGFSVARYTTALPHANHYSQIISSMTVLLNYMDTGLFVRMPSSGLTGYFGVLYSGGSFLERWDSGASTALGSGSVPATWTGTNRLEADGSTITYKLNGATLLATTDATYPSNLYAGFTLGNENTTNQWLTLDDWAGDSLVPVAATLVVADGRHTHAVDNVALTQVHTLVVADGAHTHSVDNLGLTTGGVLNIADGRHLHASDPVTLTQLHSLAVADARHLHAGDNVAVSRVVAFAYPKSVSGRKMLDQNGNVYLMRTFSSWAMAHQLTNAEITTALTGLVANHFNAVTVWAGGAFTGSGWNQYSNAAGQPFWTGTPWQSSLGAAWASLDWVVTEAERLGLAVNLSIPGWGARAQMEAATNVQMRAAGVAVASRYLAYSHIVWHAYFDDAVGPTSTIGQRIDAFFQGVNETEGAATRPVRWAEGNWDGASTTYNQFINVATPFAHVNLTLNGWYVSGPTNPVEGSTVIAETGYAEVAMPNGDVEPPYDGTGSSYYGGNLGQQLRERSWATFLEGGVYINYGHEDWWPFGASNPLGFSEGMPWSEVQAHNHTVQQSYIWPLLDTYVATPTWAPTNLFVTVGEGSGDTKAAVGASPTAALAYFPSSRAVTVDTTIITGTAPVRLRWYDPFTGTYTTISTTEAQSAGRAVSYPADHADGTADWVLVVDLATVIALTVADGAHTHSADHLTLVTNTTLAVADARHVQLADNIAQLIVIHNLAVADGRHVHLADNIALGTENTLAVADGRHVHAADHVAVTSVHALTVADASHAHTADVLTLAVGGISLTVADSRHTHSSDPVALGQAHELDVADCRHTHRGDNVNLVGLDAFSVIGGERRRALVLDPERSTLEVTEMMLSSGAHVAKRVTGDVGDTILVHLDGDEDLSLATTFVGHVQRFDTRHTLAAQLHDAATRAVLVSCDPWLPDATPGMWALEVAVGWSAVDGDTEITYPSAHEDRVSVDVRDDYD